MRLVRPNRVSRTNRRSEQGSKHPLVSTLTLKSRVAYNFTDFHLCDRPDDRYLFGKECAAGFRLFPIVHPPTYTKAVTTPVSTRVTESGLADRTSRFCMNFVLQSGSRYIFLHVRDYSEHPPCRTGRSY